MEHKSQKELQALSLRMKQHPTILFTGAGFSYGAKNGNNEQLPLGNQLKTKLLTSFIGLSKGSDDYSEWCNQPLSDIYAYCEDCCSVETAADFLKALFTECVPEPYHKAIASYHWKKIYTINIDDLMENSSDRGRLIVQNQNRRITNYNVDRKIEYIKLHGCVNNPSLGFIFSKQSYIDSLVIGGDYRIQSLSIDLQTEDFVLIGTEMDEIDIDYFLRLQKRGGESRNGQLYFVNPSPSAAFKFKIKKYGGHLIEMTCKEFAEWLANTHKDYKTVNITQSSHFLENFRDVSNFIETNKNTHYDDSQLYFGDTPNWKDIVFDWDFKSLKIDDIFNDIQGMESSCDDNIVVSIINKTLSGKSVFLKRLAFLLHKDGCKVYEYIGKEFNYKSFIENSTRSLSNRIVLIVDPGSTYYSSISKLLDEYPKSKRLIVLTADRPFFHFKKRYCLVPHTCFAEYELSQLSHTQNLLLAESAISTLDHKGYLGELKNKSHEERIKYVLKIDDLGSLVYSLTEGLNFKKRHISNYNKLSTNDLNLSDMLRGLAIFQILDLPFFPLDLIGIWKGDTFDSLLKKLDDFIKYENSNGISLRTNILTAIILYKSERSQIIRNIRELLILISPNISNSVSYWNDIQSRLMKVNLLHTKLRISYVKIKEILRKIKNYYNDDANYWIQVGIVEQKMGDYNRALNHFKQSEVLSPNSYLVQNALARNYLRMANTSSTIEQAQPFFMEGKSRMLKLIRNRDDYQAKAYSSHSYVHELVLYWRKFNITPTEEEIKQTISILISVIEQDRNDIMASNIIGRFFSYLKELGLTKYIPALRLEDIGILKNFMSSDEQEMMEDFELD